MAEPATEHPGYGWLMRNLDLLEQRFPEQWAVADGYEFFVHGAELDELLAMVAATERAPSEFALCYLTQVMVRPEDDGGGERGARFPLTGGPGGSAKDWLIEEDVLRPVLVPDASKS
jgi:hypothetical protein